MQKMNQRAAELGMKDTVFKNCNGLDEEGHVTSAYDVALMSRELIKHEKIFDYTTIWMDTLREGKTQIVNTNKLLKSYNGITGLRPAPPARGKLYHCYRAARRAVTDRRGAGQRYGKGAFTELRPCWIMDFPII